MSSEIPIAMTEASSSNSPPDTSSATTSDRPWLDPLIEPFIRLQNVSKQFGDFTAVNAVNLDIYQGELFALLGGSGCGKTTLLRLLAGFEQPNSGSIVIDGLDMNDVPPYERPVNMMFQSYALFPHMTVAKNVAYGLKRDGVKSADVKQRVDDMLAMVELSEFAKRKPHQLSGGQRQRVALARALVKKPKLLLLDEPLAALDRRLREQTQFELMNLQDELGITFIVVTHDQEEAMTLATRMAVMDRGQIVQTGTPTQIYEYPESLFTATFIGSANVFECRVIANLRANEFLVKTTEGQTELLVEYTGEIRVGTPVWVAVRPEKITLSKTAPVDSSRPNQLQGVVHDIGYLGDSSTYRIKTESNALIEVTYINQHRPKGDRHAAEWDETVYLSWHAANAVLLTN